MTRTPTAWKNALSIPSSEGSETSFGNGPSFLSRVLEGVRVALHKPLSTRGLRLSVGRLRSRTESEGRAKVALGTPWDSRERVKRTLEPRAAPSGRTAGTRDGGLGNVEPRWPDSRVPAFAGDDGERADDVD